MPASRISAKRLNAVITNRFKLITTLNVAMAAALWLQMVTSGLSVASPVWVSVVSAVLLVSGTYATVIYFGQHGLKAKTLHLLYILSLVNFATAIWALYAFVITL